jgi:conjugal transfer pilus assembly protein TraD
MLSDRNYWRPAWELNAAIAWGMAFVITMYVMLYGLLPPGPAYFTGAMALVIFLVNIVKGSRVWRHRHALFGKSVEWVDPDFIQKKMDAKPGHLWLGWGFDWDRVHMQRLYDLERLTKQEKKKLNLPWPLTNKAKPKKGSPFLHGVEPDEKDMYIDLKELEGHVFVPAMTGSMKTRLLALCVSQAIRRKPKESIILIDPKYDEQMADLMRRECIAAGRPEDFAFFHPSFPAESCRFDPIRTWTASTSVASRIASLIPSTQQSQLDPWSGFGWSVVNSIADGLIYGMKERPTLKSIRHYVEGDIDKLIHKTIVAALEEDGIDWREAIKPYMSEAGRTRKQSPSIPDETIALVLFYRTDYGNANRRNYIDGLLNMYEHDRAHAQKMLSNLIPVLKMLTAGDLGDLLSPDREDPYDHRLILDAQKIIEGEGVFYMGLDSIADSQVASSMGSICIADVAATAAIRSKEKRSLPKFNFFIDEANSVANAPLIEIMNKSRSSGFRCMILSQQVNDFVARLGNEAMALQTIGNANSTIAGRLNDAVTMKHVAQTFGKTILSVSQFQHMTAPIVGGLDTMNYSGAYGVKQQETLTEIVPLDAFSKIPDLEYFGVFTGGSIRKGRIPLIRV